MGDRKVCLTRLRVWFTCCNHVKARGWVVSLLLRLQIIGYFIYSRFQVIMPCRGLFVAMLPVIIRKFCLRFVYFTEWCGSMGVEWICVLNICVTKRSKALGRVLSLIKLFNFSCQYVLWVQMRKIWYTKLNYLKHVSMIFTLTLNIFIFIYERIVRETWWLISNITLNIEY